MRLPVYGLEQGCSKTRPIPGADWGCIGRIKSAPESPELDCQINYDTQDHSWI